MLSQPTAVASAEMSRNSFVVNTLTAFEPMC
jgi:hypothetical protein